MKGTESRIQVRWKIFMPDGRAIDLTDEEASARVV